MGRRTSVCVKLRALSGARAITLPRQPIARRIVRIRIVPIHSIQFLWSRSRIISKGGRASSDWAFDTHGMAVVVVGGHPVSNHASVLPLASMVVELLSAGMVIQGDQD